jgi:aspartyl-tRNA(Asn)/glutamyl-tRNA(Gln) amidotransferase subunit C
MPDALDLAEVERIAALARLALTDEEKRLFAGQLTRILDYARQLEMLSTEGVAPMARVDEESRLERDDEPRPSLPRDAVLDTAPNAVAGVFVVPRAVGTES